MPLFFQLNRVNAAVFPLKRRQTPLFVGSATLTPQFFQLNALNAAIFPVERR